MTDSTHLASAPAPAPDRAARQARASGDSLPARSARCALGAGLALLLALSAAPSAAEEPVAFEIPPGPLSEVLAAFDAASGWRLAEGAGRAAEAVSAGVRGRMTPAAALDRLLEGTPLRWEPAGPARYALRAGASGAAGDAAAGDSAGTRLEPVVVSATRQETPVSELTRSVTVLEEPEIQDQALLHRSVGEVLGKTTPGMSPGTEALSNFGQTLRGRRFLTLIDGIPQSTPLRGASRGLNTIDPDAVERIEVIRGGTAIYGFGATGGLVNVITRRPSEEAIEGHSDAGIRFAPEHVDDSFAYETSHRLSGTTGDFDYLLSGSFVEREGFFDASGDRIPPDPMGVQGGLADSTSWDALAKLGWNFDEGRQRLQVSANHFDFLQDSDHTFGVGDPATGEETPAVEGSFNAEDPGTRSTLVSVDYTHREALGSQVHLQAYYGDLTARFAKFPGFAQTEIDSEKWGSRLTVTTPLEIGDYGMRVLWGADYLRDKTVQEGIDGPTVVPVMEQHAVAGFAELELPVGEWALLRGGVRHERIGVDVDDVVNRLGLSVQGGDLDFDETLLNASAVVFLSDRIELFGSFSQGFSVGDIGRAVRDGALTRASDLESEAQKVDNYELGLRGRWERVHASLAAFYSESDHGTTFDTSLSLVRQPERIWGAEATLDVFPAERWSFGGTLSWAEGEVDLDDDGRYEEDLPGTRIAPLKATAYVGFDPFPWWRSRLQALYSGRRHPDSTQFGGGDVDDYLVLDLVSAFDVGPGTLEVGISNLLDEDYFTVVSQAGALSYGYARGRGRTVAFTYSVDW